MAYKVLVTDQIDEIAVRILQGVCEVDYEPVLSAEKLESVIRDYDALMIRSTSKVTKKSLSVADRLKLRLQRC